MEVTGLNLKKMCRELLRDNSVLSTLPTQNYVLDQE